MRDCSESDIKEAVECTFLGEMSKRDTNLQFVRDMLTERAPEADKSAIMQLYRDIRLGWWPIRDDVQSAVYSHLKLSGVVRREGNVLRVRNMIYEKVFDMRWIGTQIPLRRSLVALPWATKLAALIIVILLGIIVFMLMFFSIRQQQRQEAMLDEAQAQKAAAEKRAHFAQSRQRATQALQLLDDQLDLALLLSLQAYQFSDTAEAKRSLLASVTTALIC